MSGSVAQRMRKTAYNKTSARLRRRFVDCICLAVFLPIAIQNEKDYNNWVANQRTQQQIEQEFEEDNK